MTRPRVLHVITGLTTGGAETALWRLLDREAGEQFASEVASLGDAGTLGPRLVACGVPVHAIGMPRGRPTLAGVARLVGLVRGAKPDLIQGWMYHGNLAASVAARWARGRIPVLWNVRHAMHDPARESCATSVAIRAGRRATRVRRIVYNSEVGARHHERLGYPADRTVVIPNGFDCRRLRPRESARGALRERLGVGRETTLIGLVARYHPVKDHRSFLDAAARLAAAEAEAAGDGPTHFVLAGPGVDLDNAELAEGIRQRSLDGRVHLLGELADAAEVTAAFDIATSSSRSESFPNTIGEAMACAVPVVATDVGDVRSLVGDAGVVVPPRAPEALAAGWQQLLALGGEGRRELGQAGRRRIAERFDLDRVVERYRELWSATLAEAAAPAVRGS